MIVWNPLWIWDTSILVLQLWNELSYSLWDICSGMWLKIGCQVLCTLQWTDGHILIEHTVRQVNHLWVQPSGLVLLPLVFWKFALIPTRCTFRLACRFVCFEIDTVISLPIQVTFGYEVTFIGYCDFNMFFVVFKETFHTAFTVVTNDVVINVNWYGKRALFCYFEVDAGFCLTAFSLRVITPDYFVLKVVPIPSSLFQSI